MAASFTDQSLRGSDPFLHIRTEKTLTGLRWTCLPGVLTVISESSVLGHHGFLELFTVKLTKGEKNGTQVGHLGANHILKCSPCVITQLFPNDQG